MSSARYLVTSALPYANGRIHIGHLAGAYLPADIYVRYRRLRGDDVVYVCGSDEHGVPITLTAMKEGVSPREIIDRYHAANEAAFAAAGISFDIYGRTSWPEHREVTQEFFRRLDAGGHIEKRTIEQFYSERAGMFLPDRYIEGECPRCGDPGARGDQCDACGATYEVAELRNPRSALPGDGTRPVLRPTAHWFLRLDRFQDRLGPWIEGHADWRPNSRNTALGWIREGLRARCVTRDTDWGVPIPVDDPEAENKRIYVWFDAPIGYVTNTIVWARRRGDPDGWMAYWKDPSTRLIHFIGKDNIPFHAVIFPAMLLGQGDYILPDNVVANEYLNFRRAGEEAAEKFSKSRGNVIDVAEFVERFGPDRLRHYLCAIAPETTDSEFTWREFRERTNGELADIIGNFIHRAATFCRRAFAGRAPAMREGEPAGSAALDAIETARRAIERAIETFQFRAGLAALVELGRVGNRYFDEAKPWVSRKADPAACAHAIRISLELSAGIARLMRPFLPHAAARIAAILGLARFGEPGTWADASRRLAEGQAIAEPEIVLRKLGPDEVPS